MRQAQSSTPLMYGAAQRPRRRTRGYASRPPGEVSVPVVRMRTVRRPRKVCREMRKIDGVVLAELRQHYDPKLHDRGRRDAIRGARRLWERLIRGGRD